MLKPTCPLLAHPCIELRCAWWSSEYAACAVVSLVSQLTDAKPEEPKRASLKAKHVNKA